ncbi:MAG: amidohydrolase [Vicinamibacterales bacterium]
MAARVTAFLVFAIVATTLVAGLIVGAQRDTPDGPVDLIVFNGKVFPATDDTTFAEAVAVRGNQILMVGSNRDIKRLRRRQTTVIDAHGGTVLPGFSDGHVHLMEAGLSAVDADLSGIDTVEALESRLAEYASLHADLAWIRARGWRPDRVDAATVGRSVLDRAVPDRPAYVLSDDGQSAWVNTKALDLAGITVRSKAPAGGLIGRDPRTGQPNGLLVGSSRSLVEDLLPTRTRDEQLTAIRAAVNDASRAGVTSVVSMGDTPAELELYDVLRQAGELPVRIYSALAAPAELDAAAVALFEDLWKRFPDDPILKTGAVAVDVTAADVVDDLSKTVTAFDAKGWQVFADAGGVEAGVMAALSAFEQATTVNDVPSRGRRHRIDGSPADNPETEARFARLGVTAGMSSEDTDSADRPPNAFPFILISDWPEAALDPRIGLQANLTVADDGQAPGADASLHLARAIRAYTSQPAFASFDDNRRGTLAPGMLADLVVLSGDIFSLRPEKLMDARVTTTIVDGKVVYSSEPGSDD